MLEKIDAILEHWNLSSDLIPDVSKAVLFIGSFLAGVIIYFIIKWLIIKIIHRLIRRTESVWDDSLIDQRVLDKINYLTPILFLNATIPITLENQIKWLNFASKVTDIYITIVIMLILFSIINSLFQIYNTLDISKRVHAKGLAQVLRLIIFLAGFIFIIAFLFDKSPLNLFIGLGSVTAVLLLIFKDAILGFVAGIQIAANKMVIIDDWIEMPKYGADGEVTDIALTTVKVRNWDKTITTIPTYAIISEPFKNWRGMQESDGRRIKRSIFIDMNSVKFCDEVMINNFMKVKLLKNYIQRKVDEIHQFNNSNESNLHVLANRRNLTNLGTFRAYVFEYLKSNPLINSNMTLIVRQLESTPNGLPLQIYCFSSDKSWANYENIQSDIFDHLFAICSEFGLAVFQSPSGNDFKQLKA